MSAAKEAAGRRAVDLVEDGMTLGLGTGSTVWFSLVRLAERIEEEGLSVRGVPTSVDTEKKARKLGIPLTDLEEVQDLDLVIDGADEIDKKFDMIKGGGGALLREKVVASCARRMVAVVHASKVVDKLGSTFKLPVEVVPFAYKVVMDAIKIMDCKPSLRGGKKPFVTDNGNYILDCNFYDGIDDPERVEGYLLGTPGVCETGLFLGLAGTVVVGSDDGTTELHDRH